MGMYSKTGWYQLEDRGHLAHANGTVRRLGKAGYPRNTWRATPRDEHIGPRNFWRLKDAKVWIEGL